MTRLLIALAALLIFGAQLTAPVEAQGWTCTYDFSTGTHGWASGASDEPAASYSSGAWNHTDKNAWSAYRRGALIRLNVSSTTLTSASVSASYTMGTFSTSQTTAYIGVNSFTQLAASSTNPSIPFAWSGSQAGVTTVIVWLQSSYQLSASYSGSASISSITLTGTGTSPCPATPTPTTAPPTATPALTPVPYPTEAAFAASSNDSWWGNQFNFVGYGLQGWQLTNGTATNGVSSANVGGTQRIDISYPLQNARLTSVMVAYNSTCAHTFEVKDGSTVFEASSGGSGGQLIDWQGDHTMVNGSLGISLIGQPGCGAGAFQITNVFIEGYGINPTGLQATAIALNTGDLYSAFSDASDAISSLPNTLLSGVPDETGRTLFGYVKWLVSPSSADEIAGPFAPIISHTGIFLSLTFALALIYIVVWGAIWLLRLAIWLFKLILLIVDLVLQIAQVLASAVGSLGKAVGGFIGGILKIGG